MKANLAQNGRGRKTATSTPGKGKLKAGGPSPLEIGGSAKKPSAGPEGLKAPNERRGIQMKIKLAPSEFGGKAATLTSGEGKSKAGGASPLEIEGSAKKTSDAFGLLEAPLGIGLVSGADLEPDSAKQRRWEKARAMPIELLSPLIAGGEWKEEALLRFVCEVVDDLANVIHDAIAPTIQCPWEKAEFISALLMAQQAHSLHRQPGTSPHFLRPSLPGLSGHRQCSDWKLLDLLCAMVFTHEEKLFSLLDQLQVRHALGLAELMAVAEQWVYREGVECALNHVEGTPWDPSKIQKTSWEIAARAMEKIFQERREAGAPSEATGQRV